MPQWMPEDRTRFDDLCRRAEQQSREAARRAAPAAPPPPPAPQAPAGAAPPPAAPPAGTPPPRAAVPPPRGFRFRGAGSVCAGAGGRGGGRGARADALIPWKPAAADGSTPPLLRWTLPRASLMRQLIMRLPAAPPRKALCC